MEAKFQTNEALIEAFVVFSFSGGADFRCKEEWLFQRFLPEDFLPTSIDLLLQLPTMSGSIIE